MANEKREEGQIWVLAKKCNAYSIEYGDDSYGLKGKKVLVDEEKDYKKLNCETHINQCEKKNDWAEDYEICNYGIRKRK